MLTRSLGEPGGLYVGLVESLNRIDPFHHLVYPRLPTKSSRVMPHSIRASEVIDFTKAVMIKRKGRYSVRLSLPK